jgi:hypothetical protein
MTVLCERKERSEAAARSQLGRTRIAAKLLKTQQLSVRSEVAAKRSLVSHKSLKTQQLGRSAVCPLPKGREGGPLGGLLPLFLFPTCSPSEGVQ